jgi:putative transposase
MVQPPRLERLLLPLDTPTVYFVTICVARREQVLANPATFAAVLSAIDQLRHWSVSAAVLMPDHFHALVSPRKDRDLPVGDFFTGFKRTLRKLLAQQPWEWQRSGFDRLLRSHDDAQRQWLYMRENPVRAGLVQSWEQWPYLIGYREPERNQAPALAP